MSHTIADAHGRRCVGATQKHCVIWAATVSLFVEQDLLSVPADVAKACPAKPTQFMFFFSSRSHAANSQPDLVCDRQCHTVMNILQPHAAGNIRDRPYLPSQRHTVQILGATGSGGSKPDLVSFGGPHHPLS